MPKRGSNFVDLRHWSSGVGRHAEAEFGVCRLISPGYDGPARARRVMPERLIGQPERLIGQLTLVPSERWRRPIGSSDLLRRRSWRSGVRNWSAN